MSARRSTREKSLSERGKVYQTIVSKDRVKSAKAKVTRESNKRLKPKVDELTELFGKMNTSVKKAEDGMDDVVSSMARTKLGGKRRRKTQRRSRKH